MSLEDYDTILDKGWLPFMADFYNNRPQFPFEEVLAQVEDRCGGEHRRGGCGLKAVELPYNCYISP